MNLGERFKQYEDEEYLHFERIPDNEKLHNNNTICGIVKVHSLLREGGVFNICAGHDMIYLPDQSSLAYLTDKDIIYLLRCGIHYNDDNECPAVHC